MNPTRVSESFVSLEDFVKALKSFQLPLVFSFDAKSKGYY